MMAALKSQDDQQYIATEGFGLFDRVHDEAAGVLIAGNDGEGNDEQNVYRISDWGEAETIHRPRTVLSKPMLRILAQENWFLFVIVPLKSKSNYNLLAVALVVCLSELKKDSRWLLTCVFQTSNAKWICLHLIHPFKMSMLRICSQESRSL